MFRNGLGDRGKGNYAWWKYFRPPKLSYKEAQLLEKRINTAEHAAFAFRLQKTMKYPQNSIENVTILSVSHEYYDILGFDLIKGRYFSQSESKAGSSIAVLGYNIADGLFGSKEAIGREIKLLGRKLKVVGILEKQGKSLVGQDMDETIITPVNFARALTNTEYRKGLLS